MLLQCGFNDRARFRLARPAAMLLIALVQRLNNLIMDTIPQGGSLVQLNDGSAGLHARNLFVHPIQQTHAYTLRVIIRA